MMNNMKKKERKRGGSDHMSQPAIAVTHCLLYSASEGSDGVQSSQSSVEEEAKQGRA